MKAVRGAAYFLALILVSAGTVIALLVEGYPSSGERIGYVVAAFALATLVILWAHQPVSTMHLLSAGLVALALVVPIAFVHDTVDLSSCEGRRGPCHPRMDFHLPVRLGLFSAMLFAALVAAGIGWYRAHHRK